MTETKTDLKANPKANPKALSSFDVLTDFPCLMTEWTQKGMKAPQLRAFQCLLQVQPEETLRRMEAMMHQQTLDMKDDDREQFDKLTRQPSPMRQVYQVVVYRKSLSSFRPPGRVVWPSIYETKKDVTDALFAWIQENKIKLSEVHGLCRLAEEDLLPTTREYILNEMTQCDNWGYNETHNLGGKLMYIYGSSESKYFDMLSVRIECLNVNDIIRL
jgi:hypothetical protein